MLLTGANTDRGSTDTTVDGRTGANHAGVSSARDAVLSLDVKLGEDIGTGGVDGSRSEITLSSSLNHVADEETLDSLILGDATRAVGAADSGDVTTTLTILTTITTLLGHSKSAKSGNDRKVRSMKEDFQDNSYIP